MPRVLIVSPHFPPSSAADMHRVRTSLPYFKDFGWIPAVLAVEPSSVEAVVEPRLLDTLPGDVEVTRVRALPSRLTRRLGIGSIAFRAMPTLWLAGRARLARSQCDLVYFSTTAFPLMALGPLWKCEFGVPFVLDMQDPWISDYHRQASVRKPPKYPLMDRLHRLLEPWTMRHVGGLVAVSEGYITTLRRRYSWLADVPAATVPFGGAPGDFDVLRLRRESNSFFGPSDGLVHGVYVGRGGADMAPALRVIFKAFRQGLAHAPGLFARVRLHFVGTDYAPAGSGRTTMEPIAREFGLGAYVREYPARIPYFAALQLLLDAAFLLAVGSDDPQYTASKIFPYVLARRPLLAVFHEQSSVCQILADTQPGTLVSFTPGVVEDQSAVNRVEQAWSELLERLPDGPAVNEVGIQTYSAREMTRRQCGVFDQVLARGQAQGARTRSYEGRGRWPRGAVPHDGP